MACYSLPSPSYRLGTFAILAATPPPEPPLPPDHAERLAKGQDIFTRHVRAILNDQCVKCHGGDKTNGGLDLTTRELLLKGGANGPAIVPYQSKESRLYHRSSITMMQKIDRGPAGCRRRDRPKLPDEHTSASASVDRQRRSL